VTVVTVVVAVVADATPAADVTPAADADAAAAVCLLLLELAGTS